MPPNSDETEELLNNALASMKDVWLAFVWSPVNDSPMKIESIKVNGALLTAPAGEWDPNKKSPFIKHLGKYKTEASLSVEWEVTAHQDLNEIRAYITSESAQGKWKKLKSKTPVSYQESWSDKKKYEVPE